MEKYLIMCRSLTHAQRSQRLLERSGIVTTLIKAPVGLSSGGCAYALILRRHLEDSLSILRDKGMLTGNVYCQDGSDWKEYGL